MRGVGTLRDQLIYPHSREQAAARGFDDRRIAAELLGPVQLEYLALRDSGLDAVHDWYERPNTTRRRAEVLSGGEKQRVGMARLFYHRPLFAVLDESTSAVSIDVEGAMYRHARDLGVTLFTVSHRPSLLEFHDWMLRFDGLGRCSFSRIKHNRNDSVIAEEDIEDNVGEERVWQQQYYSRPASEQLLPQNARKEEEPDDKYRSQSTEDLIYCDDESSNGSSRDKRNSRGIPPAAAPLD